VRLVWVSCGFVDHADLNAAKVLKHRASRSVLPVDGVWPVQPGGSRKVEVVKLRSMRRPSKASASPRLSDRG
jgi:transposase